MTSAPNIQRQGEGTSPGPRRTDCEIVTEWKMSFHGELEDTQTTGLTGHIFLDPGHWIHPILQDGYNLKRFYIKTNMDIETQNSYEFLT